MNHNPDTDYDYDDDSRERELGFLADKHANNYALLREAMREQDADDDILPLLAIVASEDPDEALESIRKYAHKCLVEYIDNNYEALADYDAGPLDADLALLSLHQEMGIINE